MQPPARRETSEVAKFGPPWRDTTRRDCWLYEVGPVGSRLTKLRVVAAALRPHFSVLLQSGQMVCLPPYSPSIAVVDVDIDVHVLGMVCVCLHGPLFKSEANLEASAEGRRS